MPKNGKKGEFMKEELIKKLKAEMDKFKEKIEKDRRLIICRK